MTYDDYEPLITTDWLQDVFERLQKRGNQPGRSVLLALQQKMDALARIHENYPGKEERSYPAHVAAKALAAIAESSANRWQNIRDREPRNQLAQDAWVAIHGLLTALRQALPHIELPPPSDPDLLRVEFARALGKDAAKVRRTAVSDRDQLLVAVADLFAQTLLDVGDRRVGASNDGPVARMTAEVMRKAGWTITPAAVGQTLKRRLRNVPITVVPEQNGQN